jgi:hypothetical protein
VKTFNDIMENQTRDLPGCSIVCQPTMLLYIYIYIYIEREREREREREGDNRHNYYNNNVATGFSLVCHHLRSFWLNFCYCINADISQVVRRFTCCFLHI